MKFLHDCGEWLVFRTDVERNCEEVGMIFWSSRRETGKIIDCITQVLQFGGLFPAASLIPSMLLFSFFRQDLCLLVLHKHPTQAWFLGSEGEYRQTLEVVLTYASWVQTGPPLSRSDLGRRRGKKQQLTLLEWGKGAAAVEKLSRLPRGIPSPALLWRHVPLVRDEGVLARGDSSGSANLWRDFCSALVLHPKDELTFHSACFQTGKSHFMVE